MRFMSMANSSSAGADCSSTKHMCLPSYGAWRLDEKENLLRFPHVDTLYYLLSRSV